MTDLIEPHGGSLVNLYDDNIDIPGEVLTIQVDQSLQTDIYNMSVGVYSPLQGFLNKKDFQSVLDNMRLADGTIWPIPIVLDIDDEQKSYIEKNNIQNILIQDKQDNDIALLEIQDIYTYKQRNFAKKVFGTADTNHPGVAKIYDYKEFLVGGKLKVLKNNPLSSKDLYGEYFNTPSQVRSEFQNRGWQNIVAFQTRNAPHRAHEYLQKCALESCDGILVHPVIGKKKKGDYKDKAILGAYEILTDEYYNKDRTFLSILPRAMRYAGPREAVMHSIVRKNFGCSHMIIGRDHAGVGDYYGTYEAQEIFNEFDDGELGIRTLPYEYAGYCRKCNTVTSNKTCPHLAEDKILISGTKVRQKIKNKEPITDNFMRREIVKFLTDLDDPFVE